MMLTTLVVVLFVSGVASKHALLIGNPGNGERIPIGVAVKGGSVITFSGRPLRPQPFFRESINLYDFDKHLEARKIVEEGRCYIKQFRGTYAYVKSAVTAANLGKFKVTKHVSEEWNIPEKKIPADELEKTVGTKIAKFCSGYSVYWVKENKKVTKIQVARMVKRQTKVSPYFGGDGLGVKFKNNRFSGHAAGNYRPGSGLSATGRLNYDNGKGFKANAGGTWRQNGGHSVSGGASWSNGKGLKLGGNLGWSRGGGTTASLGLTWEFGK